MMRITLLDRYLLKRFFINWAIAVLVWIIIFLVVDLIENFSRFIDQQATVEQVFLYYLYYIPYIISLTLPVSTLLATLFTVNNMAEYNEIVAQLSAGISLYRFLAPLFITALIISVLAGVFNETIVPEANQRRWDIRRYDIEKRIRPQKKSRSQIFLQISKNKTLSIKFFNGRNNSGKSISLKTYRGSRLIERIDAKSMHWEHSRWKLSGVRVRSFTSEREILRQLPDTVLSDLRIQPEELAMEQRKPEEMGYRDLIKFIAELKSIGGDATKWIVEKWLKISLPFTNLIVVLLGAPIASRKRRGGVGLNFGISLLISFVYFVIIRVGQVLGHQGTLPPLLAAWLGNLVFFSLGIYALIKADK